MFWTVMLSIICLEIIPEFGETAVDVIVSTFISYIGSFVLFFYFGYFSIKQEHLTKSIIPVIVVRLTILLAATIPVSVLYVIFFRPDVLAWQFEKISRALGIYYLSFVQFNFLYAAGGGILKAAILWYADVIKSKESEKRAAATELALLKSQINPDFLFGTLTGIEELLKADRAKAIIGIENLAEIMSYMLYETRAECVNLSDEINCIRHLLKLKELNRPSGSFNLRITGDTDKVKIAPLVLLPFLEDALNNCGQNNDGGTVEIKAGEMYTEVNVKCPCGYKPPESSAGLKRILELQYGSNYEISCMSESGSVRSILRLKKNCV